MNESLANHSSSLPCLLVMVLLAMVLLATGGPLTEADDGLSLTPGTVIRWSAEGLESCALDGVSWKPLEEHCLFPIGLRKTGSMKMAVRRNGGWQELGGRVGDYPYPVQKLTIKDDSRVHLSQENLARVQRENKRIGAVLRRPSPRRFTLPLAEPLAALPQGGRFGSKRIINGSPRSPHSGADYAAVKGTPVLAVADGKVVLAEEHFFGGKSVFIDHGDELVSMALHLSEIGVEAGQEVRRGEVIGKVGSTGRSTGPHLHLGLRWHGARVDPGPLFGPVKNLVEVGRAPAAAR